MKQRIITEYSANEFNNAVSVAIQYGWYVKSVCCNDFSYTAILEKQ